MNTNQTDWECNLTGGSSFLLNANISAAFQFVQNISEDFNFIQNISKVIYGKVSCSVFLEKLISQPSLVFLTRNNISPSDWFHKKRIKSISHGEGYLMGGKKGQRVQRLGLIVF